MSSLLGDRLGMMEGAFIVHFSGAAAASLLLLDLGGGSHVFLTAAAANLLYHRMRY